MNTCVFTCTYMHAISLIKNYAFERGQGYGGLEGPRVTEG